MGKPHHPKSETQIEECLNLPNSLSRLITAFLPIANRWLSLKLH